MGGTPLVTEVGVEEGKNVFASFFVVGPTELRELSYEYQLPGSTVVQEGSTSAYRLSVQKQPGTLANPVRVEVELPPGSVVVSSAPEGATVTGERVVFQTDLRVDRQFEVVFR